MLTLLDEGCLANHFELETLCKSFYLAGLFGRLA